MTSPTTVDRIRWGPRDPNAGAKKDAETHRRQREQKIHRAAEELIAERHIGPRAKCFICGRVPTDPISIKYGIDSECWRDVLAAIHDDLKGAIP